jgi:hypothetical protein
LLVAEVEQVLEILTLRELVEQVVEQLVVVVLEQILAVGVLLKVLQAQAAQVVETMAQVDLVRTAEQVVVLVDSLPEVGDMDQVVLVDMLAETGAVAAVAAVTMAAAAEVTILRAMVEAVDQVM